MFSQSYSNASSIVVQQVTDVRVNDCLPDINFIVAKYLYIIRLMCIDSPLCTYNSVNLINLISHNLIVHQSK